jgi:hypothetical protein
VTYRLGDIGPGGGLVFLIDGGLRYEMAPNAWSGVPNVNGSLCDTVPTLVPGANGTAIGTGFANTAAMAASVACSSDAAAAVLAYGGSDASTGQWFLPSKDELNAMCNFSRNPIAPPTGGCSAGAIDAGFAAGPFAFAPDPANTWSSSQIDATNNWFLKLGPSSGLSFNAPKYVALYFRPIRSF